MIIAEHSMFATYHLLGDGIELLETWWVVHVLYVMLFAHIVGTLWVVYILHVTFFCPGESLSVLCRFFMFLLLRFYAHINFRW